MLLCATAVGLLASAAHAAPPVTRDDDDDDEAKQPLSEIVVTARRLDAARASVERSVGASSYSVSNDVVENRPGGEMANLVHALLQFPGVSQGPTGELSARSQSNLQYRINNLIVPEGFSDLADTLRARFASDIELIRGALPAQYGLQVGGVVNVTTKNGGYEHGGEIELYGGSHGHGETAFEAAGSAGATNFYASASYLHDEAGLPSIDGSARPDHDVTNQLDGFVFLDHIIDPQSRASLIAGVSSDRNELPRAAGMEAASAPNGPERNQGAYGIASYQKTLERLTYQLAASARYSAFRLTPDEALADLAAAGAAESVHNRGASAGLQAEGVYELSDRHKLRAGTTATFTRDDREAQYLVVPSSGGSGPVSLPARARDNRTAASAFLEDEWRPLDSITVNAGIRYDRVTGEGGDEMSPRLNAVWQGGSGTTVHVGYARYLVPASEIEEAGWPKLLEGTSGAPAGPASSPLRAQTDDYYDIGLEQTSEDLKLGVDAYWRDTADLLDAAPVGATLLRRPFNFADGRARGVEFDATYADGPLTAWGNVALSRAEGRRIVSGQVQFTPAQLAYLSDHFVPTNEDQRLTGSFGASYHWRTYRLSADAIYGSGLPRTLPEGTPNGARMPGYVQVNLSVVRRIEGLRDRPLDLRLDAVNLFDRDYALRDGTSLGGGAPQWGPRRGLFIGLEQQF